MSFWAILGRQSVIYIVLKCRLGNETNFVLSRHKQVAIAFGANDVKIRQNDYVGGKDKSLVLGTSYPIASIDQLARIFHGNIYLQRCTQSCLGSTLILTNLGT